MVILGVHEIIKLTACSRDDCSCPSRACGTEISGFPVVLSVKHWIFHGEGFLLLLVYPFKTRAANLLNLAHFKQFQGPSSCQGS